MFIVWGKKRVRKKIGHVADFCPMCRTAQPFALVRVGSASHVYYISAGQGELVGYERSCGVCKTALRADPHGYAAVAKEPLPIAELTRQTFPDMEQTLAPLFEVEARLRIDRSLLSADERSALIKRPFLLMSSKVEQRFASTHIDREVALSIVGALLVMVLGPAVAIKIASEPSELAVLVCIGLGVLLVVSQIALSGRRFMKRKVIPVLAASLRPLRPSQEELRGVLSELKLLKQKIGTKMKLTDLEDGIAALHASPGSSGVAARELMSN
jgi:hypothetical protein